MTLQIVQVPYAVPMYIPGGGGGGGTSVNEFATLKELLDSPPSDGEIWSIGPSVLGQTLYGSMVSGSPSPHPLEQGMDADLLGFGTNGIVTAQGTIDNESGYPAIVATGTTDGTRTWGFISLGAAFTAPSSIEVRYDYVGWSKLEVNGTFFLGWKKAASTSTLMARHREYNTNFWAGYGQGVYLGDPESVGTGGAPVGAIGTLTAETTLGMSLAPVISKTYPTGLQWVGEAGNIANAGYDGNRLFIHFTGWDTETPDICFALHAKHNAANKIRLKWIKINPGGHNR